MVPAMGTPEPGHEPGPPEEPGLRIGNIVLRVDDLERAASFWEAALGYRRSPNASDDWILLVAPGGAGPNLGLDLHAAAPRVPPRIHLDLYAADQPAEVARLLALGATEVQWARRPADADYVILADHEGNRFCVVDTSR
jgi:catechol 2,3-dioxygenase-like lactoylglutathione lyase family enzyme